MEIDAELKAGSGYAKTVGPWPGGALDEVVSAQLAKLIRLMESLMSGAEGSSARACLYNLGVEFTWALAHAYRMGRRAALEEWAEESQRLLAQLGGPPYGGG